MLSALIIAAILTIILGYRNKKLERKLIELSNELSLVNSELCRLESDLLGVKYRIGLKGQTIQDQRVVDVYE
jgi:hypothetical protein